jgi:heterodisulfide reductase subunit A-like polyferredoxin
VDIRLNTAIGPDGDYTLADLFESGYEAVCLAIGAHKGRALPIPGKNLPGVVDGIELLKAINLAEQCDHADYEDKLEEQLPQGASTRAVVLGGGNTAMDASRSLKRLGLDEVRVLYRRSREEMPALPEEVHEAEEEGVAFDFLVSPVRVLGDEQNGVTGLECARMKLGDPDASGRPRPIPIEGSEFTVDVDLVVLAIGQQPDLACLCAEDDIAVSASERIAVDQNCFSTNRPGVFAVGDAVSGANMAIIEAIGMGKRAAEAIDIYLNGGDPAEELAPIEEREVAHRPMTSEELAPKPSIPVPTIPLKQRVSSFEEVELGYNAEQAIAEAQRCLVCGPCSECMACVQTCQPGAIIHAQADSQTRLDVGAVIYSDEPSDFRSHEGVFHLPPENEQLASAAAARAMAALFSRAPATPILSQRSEINAEPRIGVVICQCGGEISNILDTQTILDQAEHWPSVVHTQAFNFSCSPEAAEGITRMIGHHQLDKLVLAGCACCSLDQICYSCTYQRVRCKTNLGVFDHPEHAERFEFVNIREQCAWAHRQHPFIATRKATQLVKAAVAKINATQPRPIQKPPVERSVLIVGTGRAAQTCQTILEQHETDTRQITATIQQIRRLGGDYVVTGEEQTWRASALVLTPQNEQERQSLFAALASPPPVWEPLDSLRPGLFYCGFDLVPEEAGAAVAARVSAWLGRATSTINGNIALVDPIRCRACGTCVEVCEFGAPGLIEQDGQRHSWIDPVICTGCGTCAVHCPSGAITAAEASEAQLDAMLTAILT